MKGGPFMDAQEKTKEMKKPCLICGIRRRREDCLVCLPCNEETGSVGRLRKKLEAKNEKAVLAGKLEQIIDVWDEIFKFVLEEGQKTIEKKQAELSEAIELRNVRALELSDEAERNVGASLSALSKGGNKVQYLASQISRESLIQTCLDQLKREDGAHKKVYGLGRCIMAMKEQHGAVHKKRKMHLEEIERKLAEADELSAAVA